VSSATLTYAIIRLAGFRRGLTSGAPLAPEPYRRTRLSRDQLAVQQLPDTHCRAVFLLPEGT
jgi:hypothetical protein